MGGLMPLMSAGVMPAEVRVESEYNQVTNG